MKAAPASVRLVKMHGTENAFAVLDERPPRFDDYAELARALCAPSGPMGGADGLLVVLDPPDAAGSGGDAFSAADSDDTSRTIAEMRVFNADGSIAEMCGNGVRCVARYLAERGAGDAFAIATLAGRIGVRVRAREPFDVEVEVGPVGFPNDGRAETIALAGTSFAFHEASLGNPHAVAFVDDVDLYDLVALGEAAQAHARFPAGVNLHLAQTIDRSTLRVRHFERGVGPTRACGTGAVACAAVAIVARDATSPVVVRVPGGDLGVAWRPGETARLRGPAETLFERDVTP